MAAPFRRHWSLIMLIVALGALSSQVAATHFAGLRTRTKARAAMSEHVAMRYAENGIKMLVDGEAAAAKRPRRESLRYARYTRVLDWLTVLLTILALGCWAAAIRSRSRRARG